MPINTLRLTCSAAHTTVSLRCLHSNSWPSCNESSRSDRPAPPRKQLQACVVRLRTHAQPSAIIELAPTVAAHNFVRLHCLHSKIKTAGKYPPRCFLIRAIRYNNRSVGRRNDNRRHNQEISPLPARQALRHPLPLYPGRNRA